MIKNIKISIAGIGTVGSSVVRILIDNNKYFIKKSNIQFEIIGISGKNKNKKRNFNIDDFIWYENPLDLINIAKPEIFIELIGEQKGISYNLIKNAINNKINVVTANKALLAHHGDELFSLAEKNNVLLLYEASVAGNIPIVNTIKKSLFLNKVNKISGILNGTTNYILSNMYNHNVNFKDALLEAQKKGYAELNPKNDIEGLDSAHKLTILSTLCFGVKINFNNVIYKGISDLHNNDIKFGKQLGYKIKLISTAQIINNKIVNIVEPTLIKATSKLANVDGVLNGINIEVEKSKSIFIEGEGAGGDATAGSIIADLFEISKGSNLYSLGFKTKQLINIDSMNNDEFLSSFYLRIVVKDIPGVLAKITSYFNDEGISIETILQLPENLDNNLDSHIPIIITTHETRRELLNKVLYKINKLEFIMSKIIIITIDKNII